ncbi:hypothetical protein [Rosenbergiella metrosideri]|uniref:hypothetical protein n=1 Tax=Rosenbergiella metrosideri TaxID=2921185 RepID=UPI001F4F4349|nr:hypothetical protein [Rosenbergiella metrosideri]
MNAPNTYAPPIETLRYIVMLCDGLTVSQIAAQVGKTRQAVAQALVTYETRTGTAIIESVRPTTTLTLEGKGIAMIARDAVEQYDYANKLIAELNERMSKESR